MHKGYFSTRARAGIFAGNFVIEKICFAFKGDDLCEARAARG